MGLCYSKRRDEDFDRFCRDMLELQRQAKNEREINPHAIVPLHQLDLESILHLQELKFWEIPEDFQQPY